MAEINQGISESLREYLILTDWITTPPEQVSLATNLGSISLQYPYMTSRMQCVVGPEMAVAAGRNGILTMIPRSLRDKDKQEIIDANKKAKLKKGQIEFQENPVSASRNSTLEEVARTVARTGHSIIPITDRFSKIAGVYVHNSNNPPPFPPTTLVGEVMTPIPELPWIDEKNLAHIEEVFKTGKIKFLPVVDSNGILKKIAFLQRFDTNHLGIAVSTKGTWQKELEKWASQVDTLTIDSSNACFPDALTILKYVKQKYPDKPFGIGNIIRGKDFKTFAAAGADYIIAGMGVGSICKTGSERGNGRGQMTVARELAQARDDYYSRTGKYIQLVLDGSISTVKDMTVALAFGDFIMMGNYFNKFYEAAAEKFQADKKTPTLEENLVSFVETWGEGHPRARLVAMYGINFRQAITQQNPEEVAKVIERYGHSTLSGATVEGVVGLANYRGRLKPCVEGDARYIKTTISNAGAFDLASFREKAVLERASQQTLKDMLPHDIEITEQ